MGHLKEGFIDIIGWLKSDRDYNAGVLLYQKFGKNRTLKSLFPGKEKRYANKLAIELAKTAGISIIDFQNNNFGDDTKVKKQDLNRADSKTNIPVITSQKLDIIPPFKPTGNVPLVDNTPVSEYPPMVRKLLHLYNSLYHKRSVLHKQMGDLPQNNEPENVEKRKQISDQLELISAKLDPLYDAKKKYLEEKILPEELNFEEFEAVLNDQVKTKPAAKKTSKKKETPIEEMSEAELIKKRTNLRIQLTKQKNLLEFQHTSAKGKEPNPMPEGPKKQKVLDKISKLEQQLSIIDTRLDADQSK